MTEPIELLLIKFNPALSMAEWIDIKLNAVADGTASHMSPHFWRGELIGIMFDDADMAVMFKLSTQHPTKT